MQSQRLDELLRAERQIRPDPAAEARNWAAIEHRLTHGPPPPPAAEAAPAALGKLTALKLVAGLALVVGVGGLLAAGGGPAGREPAQKDRVEVAAAPVAAPVREDRSESPAPAGPPTGVPMPAPAVAEEPAREEPREEPAKRPVRAKKASGKAIEPAPVEAPPAEDDFAAELQLVAEIRGALKRGDHAGALKRIDEHARRFGAGGQLVQERLASQVEALCGVGRVDDARRVAAELLKKWPDSTHAPRVRASCAGG